MKKIFILIFPVLLLNFSLRAQHKEQIIIEAGTPFLDYFTVTERYLYPKFKTGIILFNMNTYTERKLNYNYLIGEMEFIDKSDTLIIKNNNDIKSVIVDQDTFYCDNGYILQIRDKYPKVGLKEYIEFMGINKKDSYGVISGTSATFTLNALPTDGNYYKLNANRDLKFQRTKMYYISTFGDSFVLFNRRNLFKLYSKNRETIKSFLKTNNTKFDSEDDLLKLAEYLGSL